MSNRSAQQNEEINEKERMLISLNQQNRRSREHVPIMIHHFNFDEHDRHTLTPLSLLISLLLAHNKPV